MTPAPTPPLTTSTALVAGASRALGLEVAQELARRGFHVEVCARDAAELERGAALSAEQGRTVGTSVVDVTDSDAVAAWVRSCDRPDRPVTVAIHVAGVIQVGPIEAATAQMFDECIDIMAKAPAYLALAVLPRMRARGHGRIGIISSIGGIIGVPHLVPYSTAKFAAAGLGQALQAELAGTGVTVTTITPPPMRSGSHLHAQFYGNREEEYAWFAPAATIPGISLRVSAAARRVVDATLDGRTLATLSPVSELALRVQGLAPRLTVRGLGLAKRLLPDGARGAPLAGHDVRRRRRSVVVDTLTTVGDRVARRTNSNRRATTDPDPAATS